MEIDLDKYLEKNEMKGYSVYLDKEIVEKIKKKIKVPLSRILNNYLNKLSKQIENIK